MKFEFSAGFVVYYYEKEPLYLVLHYGSEDKPLHWDFPKGKIEKGEKALDAAIRELKEETGIENITVIDGFKDVITYFFIGSLSDGKREKIKKQVTFFLCEAKDKTVRLSWEHIDYAWLPYEKAINQLTFRSAREILERAHKFVLKNKNEQR